jgi:hypothetical protein
MALNDADSPVSAQLGFEQPLGTVIRPDRYHGRLHRRDEPCHIFQDLALILPHEYLDEAVGVKKHHKGYWGNQDLYGEGSIAVHGMSGHFRFCKLF